MRWSVLVVAMTFVWASCASAPPALSPKGVAAYRGTQVIQTLDLLRDAAIAANKETPPLLSTDTTRKVVTYHKSSITVVHASAEAEGWQPTVLAGLEELVRNIPAQESTLLAPYVTLIRTLLNSR